MTTDAPPPVWDPLHPDFRADPYPWYEALRNADPVHRIDDYTVVLTRHDDVLRTRRSRIRPRYRTACCGTDQ